MKVRRGRDDRGAAAVEFALVVPLLLALLLGIIDYGMWFADTLSARQGVREGARSAVVETFDGGGCSGQANAMLQTGCTTSSRIGAISGSTWVRVKSTKVNGTAGWEQGGSLTVCAIVKSNGVTGFTPLPSNRIIFSSVVMRIEEDGTPVTSPYSATYGGTVPSGFSWPAACS